MAESNLHPDMDSQKRRSTRIVQAVPITVTGVDALGRPFQERTSTLIINCHGCRYQSKHYVLKNMWVTFEVPHNQADTEPRSVRARVTWIQRPRTVRELFQIGVELEVCGNVWGIAFPPGDWFPFPESVSNPEIQEQSEDPKTAPSNAEWSSERALAQQASEPVEDNIRVVPFPGGADASQQIARQVARIVAEVKQQVQGTARETATRAVAAETRTLLAALQAQLRDAAEKSVQTAIAAQIERTQSEARQRTEENPDANVTAMSAEWSRELDRRTSEARRQMDSQLQEVERSRRAEFEQQIHKQLSVAIEKLQSLSGTLYANASEVRNEIEQLRKSSAEAAAQEKERWQGIMAQISADAQARLARLEQAAKRLDDQISAATSIAEAGWRGLLEANVNQAAAQWNEKMESAAEDAARRAAERLATNSEDSARQIEQQLQQRISTVGGAFSQATAEAERVLGTLREAISQEAAKAESTISQLQQSFERLEARRNEFSSFLEAASQQWTQRGEAVLAAQSDEIKRRTEAAVNDMALQLQPTLETAAQQTIERLAGGLEQRFAPQIAGASEILSKLDVGREDAEKALAEHQNRVWQASDRNLQETAARSKELLAQIEKEFVESARSTSTKCFSELEAQANETTHSTFEALFKSADWYEKKVQSQMQATLEKGLDQAIAAFREKAGELSSLFASELDHYSRSYVEHAQDQIQDNARDAVDRVKIQMAEASGGAAAIFSERAAQLGREQLDLLQSKMNSAFEQTVAGMEAHNIQVRSKLESDARAFAAEFQRVLAQHKEQSVAQGKQELASEVEIARTRFYAETQSFESQFRDTLQSLGTSAMEEHKHRLENASNTWLLTTVSKLNQQSEELSQQLAASTEKHLKTVCDSVFNQAGETLKQRLAGLSAAFTAPLSPAPPSVTIKPSENNPEEQK